MRKLGRLFLLVGALSMTACVGDPTQPDEFEPNSVAEPTSLGNFSDSGTHQSFELTLHDGVDEDAFELTISDDGIDGNPEVNIIAASEGSIADLVLSVDFVCSDASGGHQQMDENSDAAIAFVTSCPGGGLFDDNDSGSAIITVKRKPGGSTAPLFYDLTIDVD